MVQEETQRPFLLIIDDDLRILRALRLVLRADYEVLLAASLSEARTQLESAPVDIVLCDQRMPDGLGTEFLSLLARERPHTVRLLHSGSPPEDVPALMASGAVNALIVKPASVADLRASIETHHNKRKNS